MTDWIELKLSSIHILGHARRTGTNAKKITNVKRLRIQNGCVKLTWAAWRRFDLTAQRLRLTFRNFKYVARQLCYKMTVNYFWSGQSGIFCVHTCIQSVLWHSICTSYALTFFLYRVSPCFFFFSEMRPLMVQLSILRKTRNEYEATVDWYWQKQQNYLEKNFPSVTSSTVNPTWFLS